MKKLLLIPILTIGFCFSQTVDNHDEIRILIPKDSHMFDFCLNKDATICTSNKKPNEKKYSGMKGKLTSLEPIATEYGNNNIFEVKMDNGDLLYYSTKNDSPFKGGGMLNLEDHLNTLNRVGSSLIEGGKVTIDNVEYNMGSYQYLLSTGQKIYGDTLKNIELILPNISIENEEKFIKMTNGLNINYDPMEDIFLISISNYGIKESSAIEIYIGLSSEESWLRFRLFYGADEWLFSNKVLIKTDDDRKEISNLTFNRNHSGGTIWESFDRAATDSDRKLIEKVIDSELTVVRFYGKNYYSDRKINAKQKIQLKNILSIYDMLNY